jgi:hypothetical protein
MGSRASLDVIVKRNNMPLPGIEPRLLGHPVRSLVTIPTELSRLFAPYRKNINSATLHLSLLFASMSA